MNGDKDVVLRKPTLPPVLKEVEKETPPNMVERKFIAERINSPLNIFLSSGVKLDCSIISFDDICIITTQKDNSRKKQLVYKANITSIAEK